MKEKPAPPTDPILEEIYRMEAQFNSMEELSAHLKEIEKGKARGRKYVPAPPPSPNFEERIEKCIKNLEL